MYVYLSLRYKTYCKSDMTVRVKGHRKMHEIRIGSMYATQAYKNLTSVCVKATTEERLSMADWRACAWQLTASVHVHGG